MFSPVIDSCTIRNPLPGHDQSSSSDYPSAVYDYNEGFPGDGYLNMGFGDGGNLLCDFDGGDFISAPENGLQRPPGETTTREDGGEFSGQHSASSYHSVVCDYNVGFPGNADSGLGFGQKNNGDFGSGDFFSSSTYNTTAGGDGLEVSDQLQRLPATTISYHHGFPESLDPIDMLLCNAPNFRGYAAV